MRFIIILISLCLAGCATTQNFVEKASITQSKAKFPALSTFNEGSVEVIDHSAFNRFLQIYLVEGSKTGSGQGVNLVRYKDVTHEDRAALDAYTARLQAAKVSKLGRNEQLAFWINLYNADTIRAVLENYPVTSIREIKSIPLDFKGPWNDKRLTVEGTRLTLDNIENRIVRPVFKDPRIHYALNCAAIGCPNLRAQAYTGEGLDAALDEQTRAFINSPRGVKAAGGKVTASRIFLWYEKDYGGSEADVLDHIRAFAAPELLQALKGVNAIDRYAYDWRLNAP